MTDAIGINNLSIRTKIAMTFALVVALVVGMGITALTRASATNDQVVDLTVNYVPSLVYLDDMRTDAALLRSNLNRELATMASPRQTSAQEARLDSLFADYRSAEQKYALTVDSPQEAALYRDIQADGEAYFQRAAAVRQLIHDGNRTAAEAMLIDSIGPLADKFGDAIHADMALNADQSTRLGESAKTSYATGRFYLLSFLAAVTVIAMLAGVLLVSTIAGPIKAMTEAMRRLAGKDTSVVIPARGRGDEVGQMAEAVDVFKQNMIETDRLRAEQEALKARNAAEQRETLNRMADGFEARVGAAVKLLATGSSGLKDTAQALSATADRSTRQASTVAAAAEEASLGVQTVASAAEELTASIGEISRQVAQSAKLTRQAVTDAQRTDGIVRALADGSQKIGAVVDLIANIAGQTNLLALNATIEAARAGDAGKGFAVVASEVKSLATQTAKATDEIGSQIQQIQTATRDAVEAIRGISGTIDQISATATTIASAVEQQGAATGEIARNVQQTSQATREVTQNMNEVSQAANDTGGAAGQVLHVATEVSTQAELVRAEVGRFVAEVRAA
jgi:methyl-accepting chemotaxis protein